MTALDRVAVVSDVHGNLTAYQAVLADIDAGASPGSSTWVTSWARDRRERRACG